MNKNDGPQGLCEPQARAKRNDAPKALCEPQARAKRQLRRQNFIILNSLFDILNF